MYYVIMCTGSFGFVYLASYSVIDLVQQYDSNHPGDSNPSIKLLRHHGLGPDVSKYLFALLFFLNVAFVLSLEAFVMSQGECSLRIHPAHSSSFTFPPLYAIVAKIPG